MSITTNAIKTVDGRLTVYVHSDSKNSPLAVVYKGKLFALSPLQNQPALTTKILAKSSRKFGISEITERYNYILSAQTGKLLKHQSKESYVLADVLN